MGDFDWMRRADSPHRSPGSQHRAPQPTWEAEQARGLITRGRIMFLGIVVLVAGWELGPAIAGGAEPSVIRLALVVALLYAAWLGGVWAVWLVAFVFALAAADRFFVAATEGDLLEFGVGIAMAGIGWCLMFSKSLSAFFRHQRGADDGHQEPDEYSEAENDVAAAEKQALVYAARTFQHANVLKNMLAEAGIEALVIYDLQGEAGEDAAGRAAEARVLVDEKDAEVARQIARDFDHPGIARAAVWDDEAEDLEVPGGQSYQWPRCPQCDAPRPARCPVCHTIGSDFPQADPDFVDPLDLQQPAEGSSAACCAPGASCGEDAAAAGEAGAVQPPSQPTEAAQEPAAKESPAALLVCPTCDEPFLPEFPRRCALCDYEFDDGVEITLDEGPPEQIGTRAVAVLFGLVALLMGLVIYFVFLL